MHISNLQYSFLSVGIQLLEEVAERGRKSHCIFSYQIYLTMSNYIMVDCQQKKCLGNVFQEHNKNAKKTIAIVGFFWSLFCLHDSDVSLLGTLGCFHFFKLYAKILLHFTVPSKSFPCQTPLTGTIM